MWACELPVVVLA